MKARNPEPVEVFVAQQRDCDQCGGLIPYHSSAVRVGKKIVCGEECIHAALKEYK